MKRCAGISLIDLSVVLIVIGLLAGSIMGASIMIKNARLAKVMRDIHLIEKALYDFDDKYGAPPGDIANMDILPPNAAGTGGNGNGIIDSDLEAVRFWYHLAITDFMVGNADTTLASRYNIAKDSTKGGAKESPFPNAGYRVIPNSPLGLYVIGFAEYSPSDYNLAVIEPAVAEAFDRKYDNGIAGSGKIQATEGTGFPAGTCVKSDKKYNISNDKVCRLMFILETYSSSFGGGGSPTCNGSAIGTIRESAIVSCFYGQTGKVFETCVSTGGGATWQNTTYQCTPVQCYGGALYGEIRKIACPYGYKADPNPSCLPYFNNKPNCITPVIVQRCEASGVFKDIVKCCVPETNTPCSKCKSSRNLECPITYTSNNGPVVQVCKNYKWTTISDGCTPTKCKSGSLFIGEIDSMRHHCQASPSCYAPDPTTTTDGVMKTCTIPLSKHEKTSGMCHDDNNYTPNNSYDPSEKDLRLTYNNCRPTYGPCAPNSTINIGCPIGETGFHYQRCNNSGYFETDRNVIFLSSIGGEANTCKPVRCGVEPLGSYRISKDHNCPSGFIGKALEICALDSPSTAKWILSYHNCVRALCPKSNWPNGGDNDDDDDDESCHWSQGPYLSGKHYEGQCKPGYEDAEDDIDNVTFAGKSKRKCDHKGYWHKPDRPCVKYCPREDLSSTHGIIWEKSQAPKTGMKAYYTSKDGTIDDFPNGHKMSKCKNGYGTTVRIKRYCKSDGNWHEGSKSPHYGMTYVKDDDDDDDNPLYPQNNSKACCIECQDGIC
jgi:type II secretory pathway pseudopilin PulG